MATFFKKRIVDYSRFAGLLLWLGVGACKSETASKQTDLMLEKQNQKPSSTFSTVGSTEMETDQKDNVIPAKGNSEGTKNDNVQVEANHPHKNSKEHPEKTDQVDAPPSFTFPEKITIQVGTKQSTMLKVTGITEGYIIKSISVTKNETYYTNKFRITNFNKKPIPSSGLPITLTADAKLKAGSYLLSIKIGKTGTGSRKTEQWVKCMIHIVENASKK